MTTSNDTGMTVRVERVIAARPHQVYRAWLEPELIGRWMSPGPMEVSRAEVDERVGGHYGIWHSMDGAAAGGFDAEILELVPDQRIVWRWGFAGPERRNGPVYDSLLTITLREAPGGATALVLVHARLDELAAAMPDVATGVGPGWEDVLAKLAAVTWAAAR